MLYIFISYKIINAEHYIQITRQLHIYVATDTALLHSD
jgi:hypothetical protein